MSQALVVGGSNQISAHLIPRLLADGQRVCVRSRGPRPGWIAAQPRLQWLGSDQAKTPGPRQVDTLYFLSPLQAFDELVPDVSTWGRVVAFSSTSLLSKADSDNPEERAMAAELADGEMLIQSRCEAAGAPWTLLRPTLVYGAGLDRNLTRMAAAIRRWRLFPLVGKGDGLRQPVHADDLAASAMAAADNPAAANRCYALGGGSTISYREMVVRVFRSLALTPRFVYLPGWSISPAVKLARCLPRWRDLTPQMLQRMNTDLVFDDSAARNDFGHDPRPFHPTAACWSLPAFDVAE